MNRSQLCISVAISTALLLGSLPALGALDRAQLARLSMSLVKVEATDGDARMSLGSGVAVGPERIVTNCHVIPCDGRPPIQHGEALPSQGNPI